jgi:hypothetical protein
MRIRGGSPPIVENSAGYFCIYIIRFDNKKNCIIIKIEGFDDRVRLRVNSEDRFILYVFFLKSSTTYISNKKINGL